MVNKKSKKFKQRLAASHSGEGIQITIPREHPQDGVPIWDSVAFMRKVLAAQWDICTTAVCDFLCFFEKHNYRGYSKEDINTFNKFVTSTILLLTHPNYKVENQLAFRLVSCGHLFSNIVTVSGYETTDAILKQLINEGNLIKLCFCQNSRSKLQANVKAIFDANPMVASLWYNTYMLGVGCPTELQQANLHSHIKNIDERWSPVNSYVSCPMFTCTYFNQKDIKRAKTIMNNAIKKLCTLKFTNTPDPLSVAIVTSKWHRNHAVYKSAGPQVEQLLGKYKLTLIHLGAGIPDTLVKDYFDKIHSVAFDKQMKLVVPDEVLNNDFQFVYYPDIGMIDEGIWLSNHRMAPIQAVGYGHPDTTGCSEIDYTIGGDIEKDCAEWYSEKLVLIPGLAQHPAIPTAPRQHNWVPKDKVHINCVWGPDKYNHTLLRLLAEVNNRCGTDGHIFKFFPSPGVNRYTAIVPFLRDITRIVPNNYVHTDIEYYDYMREAEKNDFSINSFPFGGYNTVVESFYMGLPCVCLEGGRFYNRAGSHLNRQIGMPEMTTTDVGEFIEIICKMIKDKEYLAAQRAKLATTDLQEKLFNVSSKSFLKAVEHIIENHPLQTNPTLIGELYGNSL